ncbi:uncharacterized protein DEA37_0006679 [Paragonimus westermani]|uniref:Uncharacterized protein n=1 Tax=Paragonimus westermani TaxID=34504 RepID=A0A5J4P1R3_9TREM|nr:uncharacterized protein DEA37_0006679 [Paragonimus westermani]
MFRCVSSCWIVSNSIGCAAIISSIRKSFCLGSVRNFAVFSEYYPFVSWRIMGELDDVEFPPDRRKLHLLQRAPAANASVKPAKHARHLIDYRGPEEVRNKLVFGQYGIQVRYRYVD